jgi:hypothetical protein
MHNPFSRIIVLAGILFCLLLPGKAQTKSISLAGRWQFAMDRNDEGITQEWFRKDLADSIILPGSMLTNNKGEIPTLQTKWTGSIYDSSWYFNPRLAKYRQSGNLYFPFWLTPAKHYVGVAWYRKTVVVPADWKGQHIILHLERVHTISNVWIDDKEMGMQNSLSTAHQYDLGSQLSPGKHTISIRIDNQIKDMNVGPDSHSVTDHTQGNWNGIIGRMELKAGAAIYVKDLQVYPDIAKKQATVKIVLATDLQTGAKGKITINTASFNSTRKHILTPFQKAIAVQGDSTPVELILPMGDKMLLWDEFGPALYRMTLTVTDTRKRASTKTLQFGMYAFGIDGKHFTINGRPVFLRGTVNNCEFPLTGYPPMDINSWLGIFKVAKAHGLNHMRFHSWCPPEAAFAAADLAGFYLQPEVDSWPNHGTSLGDSRFIDQYIYDESNRMARAYGNHPSFCMLAAGNEPAGRNQAKYLANFVLYWKAKDKRRVYTGASVAMSWPLVPENEYMVKSGARGLSWSNSLPETESDYSNAVDNFPVPYVSHEMGQWCVFPDFKEIPAYTGAYKAKNFELFRQDLADHGMGDMAEKFLMASGKLQTICYKNEIEKALRTPGLAGFQLLGLQDFPGQGSAIVGTLNAFWKEKGYTSATAFRQFCNTTVPLMRTKKFVYTNAEGIDATVEVYHCGNKPIEHAVVKWKLMTEKGEAVLSGQFQEKTILIGTGKMNEAGNIHFDLSRFTWAAKLTLQVSIDKTPFTNQWEFWVYPASLPEVIDNTVYYCDTLDAKAEAVLQNGGKVFLQAAGKIRKGSEIVNYFTPVFWNTSWFKMRPPHTLGFVCNPRHPAFSFFPTANHSNLQWWEIVNRAQVMHLEAFPKSFQPLLQPIDTWFMNRKLAMLLEARVGKGKLLLSSVDLKSDMEKRPAARQLLYSLEEYIQSAEFNPQAELSLQVVRDLFTEPSEERWDAHTKDSPDELKPKTRLKQ